MGFDIYVAWSEHGEPASVPFAALEELFAGAIKARSASALGTSWILAYGNTLCEALIQGDGTRVTCVSIDRPVGALDLWNALLQAMNLGHGVCFWPGDAYAVATEADRAHVPLTVIEDREPSVVSSGIELRSLVESS
jgi:hypothetical protein